MNYMAEHYQDIHNEMISYMLKKNKKLNIVNVATPTQTHPLTLAVISLKITATQ